MPSDQQQTHRGPRVAFRLESMASAEDSSEAREDRQPENDVERRHGPVGQAPEKEEEKKKKKP